MLQREVHARSRSFGGGALGNLSNSGGSGGKGNGRDGPGSGERSGDCGNYGSNSWGVSTPDPTVLILPVIIFRSKDWSDLFNV
jgi:hypothetical protein